ncbi:MAG: hypothetical protein M3P00_05505 [Gemmatimonadota bacterium]|nr:hypothetical protein [Gemmatimonadota bacterium]
MKAVIITLALAGLVTTASADAQILGTRLPTPTTSRTTVNGSWEVIGRDGSGYTIYERRVRDANGNIVVQRARRDSNGNMTIISSRVETNSNVGGGNYGSWQVVGRDANGYTIYERRTTDRNGNIVIQRARRESNGNMTIISSRTVASNDNRNNRNCDYSRTNNTVGDIIFGRTNDVNCDDVGNRVDGGWYQVGRGRDNNSVYERRTRDANGNLIIQKARRNSDGTFRILSTRYANDNDKQWQKAEKRREKEYRKDQKEQEKEYNKAQKEQEKDYKHENKGNKKNH